MIYMGQELGEQASDSEGYIGYDGRTTIFDYWSLGTLRRWLNGGHPSEERLTARERWLRNKYATILNICNKQQAIREGAFFDLMYVNYENPSVNPHRQYIFLRHYGEETLIVAVNFSPDSADMHINIPEHAFEVLGMKKGTSVMTELLSGEKLRKEFSPDKPFDAFVAPFDAVIWKVKPRASRRKKDASAEE